MIPATKPDLHPPINADSYAYGSWRYAWLVTLILSGLQIVSNMERQILSLVVEPLKQDFMITDVQVSLLQGIAFALFYSLVAIPIGWLADRWRRDWIIIIGMIVWAVATLACLIAQSYSQLFCARLMIGLADAALVPASFSLISDYFPKAKMAGAIGTVTGATFLGTGASLTFGGMLLGMLPSDGKVLLPIFGSVHGWQLSFGIMCLAGLLLLVAMLAVREPPRRAGEEGKNPKDKVQLGDVARYIVAHRSYLVPLIGGIVLLTTYQYGVTNWAVSLFIRAYGWSAAQIGLLYGLYFMIIGTVASLMGGKLCDYLRSKGHHDANCMIPLVATCLLLPLAVLFALNGSAIVSTVLLGIITFLVVFSFGPAMAAIPAYVPSTMRAQTVAITMLLSTLIGAGGGPWLVAMFTENVFGSAAALPYSLAICAPLLLIPAGFCFFQGARAARRSSTVSLQTAYA